MRREGEERETNSDELFSELELDARKGEEK